MANENQTLWDPLSSHRKRFFSVKLTQNFPFSTRGNKKETKTKRIFQEVMVTTRESRLLLLTKITYGNFLKRKKKMSWGQYSLQIQPRVHVFQQVKKKPQYMERS